MSESVSFTLYQYVDVPFTDGTYTVTATNTVNGSATDLNMTTLASNTANFQILGPRYALDPADIAMVYPTPNSTVLSGTILPHIAFYRQTLPWERDGILAKPQPPDPSKTPDPWLFLLVLNESEGATLARSVQLPTNLTGGQAGVTGDMLTVPANIVTGILPPAQTRAVLAHLGTAPTPDWTGDAIAAAGASGGTFAFLLANRSPTQYTESLLSELSAPVVGAIRPIVNPIPDPIRVGAVTSSPNWAAYVVSLDNRTDLAAAPTNPVQFVVLYHWNFTVVAGADFGTIAKNLNVGMMGADISDTGHVSLTMSDRLGAQVPVWYRGPLVPAQVTRDTAGPYYSADQCRVLVETTTNISYSSAFEVGRLLAISDARLAQDLLAWRRDQFADANQGMLLSTMPPWLTRPPGATALTQPTVADIASLMQTPTAARFAVNAVTGAVNSARPPLAADPLGVVALERTLAVQAPTFTADLQAAFPSLTQTSVQAIQGLVSSAAPVLGSATPAPAVPAVATTTLAQAMADQTATAALSALHDKASQLSLATIDPV